MNVNVSEEIALQKMRDEAKARDAAPLASISDLREELRRLGWPEPTESGSDVFAWSVVNRGTKVRHVIAAWWGSELHHVEDPITGQVSMQPTGRVGVFVTGNATVRTTVGDAVEALQQALSREDEPELLAMFGLRREWGFPKSQVVPLNKVFSPNEYADVLRQQGYY